MVKKLGFFEAGVLQNLALLAVFGFAWTKLGVGTAAKEILRTTKVLSAREILGPTVPEGWKVTPIDGVYNKLNPLPGYTFAGDYPPWYMWEPVNS